MNRFSLCVDVSSIELHIGTVWDTVKSFEANVLKRNNSRYGSGDFI